jgi:hypothetical protein
MEINERASTSIDGPLSPPVVDDADDKLKKVAQKSSEKLNAYIQGQIQVNILIMNKSIILELIGNNR